MTENIFKKIKENIRISQVAEHFGLHIENGKAICPLHKETTPSFLIKEDTNTFKCFGCGAGGDAVDFVSRIKNIDKTAAANMIEEAFNLNLNSINIKNYIVECKHNISKTNYFQERGMIKETIEKYNLGYDIQKNCVVIPYNIELSYYQLRSTVMKAFYKPSTAKAGKEPLFNADVLFTEKNAVIFIVESPICAMSISQGGGQAVALCGICFIKLLKILKDKEINKKIILSLDNDEAGQSATYQLSEELDKLKIDYKIINISDECKDPNELLIKGADRLYANIKRALEQAADNYLQTSSDSAEYLVNANLEPVSWIVENILPTGLSIICAPSKTGKSWMMLQMCLAVSGGGKFLEFNTIKSDCLYLALEDSKNRLKERIIKLLNGNNKAPPNLYLSTRGNPMDNGLFYQLEKEINLHPKIKLIVIDTLQKIRGKASKNETSYTSDYRDMSMLKEFADNNKICILLVHHLRKMKDEDVFNQISGSNGIMGACDTVFILTKEKRESEEAVLSMTGRDIHSDKLIIRFDEKTCLWEKVCEAGERERISKQKEYEKNPLIKTIKVLLVNNSSWSGTISELLKIYKKTDGGNAEETPISLGMKLLSLEQNFRNIDGIIHLVKRKGNKRIHYFTTDKGENCDDYDN